MKNDIRPIGVFDSGLGGLTTVSELRRTMPGENIVYFGDTSRVPYGTRSRETVRRYARQDMRFLLSRGVKMIIAACNTASASILPEDIEKLPVPFVEVLHPAVEVAAAATRNGKIGLIGTPATIRSGAYERAMHEAAPDIQMITAPCALFVPLVENGFTAPDNEVTRLVAEQYLAPILESGADTLILGCTHYPVIKPIIARIMGKNVTLVDSGQEAAHAAQRCLLAHDMCNLTRMVGSVEYFVSDSAAAFAENARPIVGEPVSGHAMQIDIESV